MTVGDVAKDLKVTPVTVRLWADAGRLAATRTAGGVRVFDRGTVERFKRRRAGLDAGVADAVERERRVEGDVDGDAEGSGDGVDAAAKRDVGAGRRSVSGRPGRRRG